MNIKLYAHGVEYMVSKGKKHIFSFPSAENLITVQSGKRLVMENVERIVFCQKERIVLRGKTSLEILGEELHLEELGNGNLAVCGSIRSIHFGEGEQ
jgi:hypothetical protein